MIRADAIPALPRARAALSAFDDTWDAEAGIHAHRFDLHSPSRDDDVLATMLVRSNPIGPRTSFGRVWVFITEAPFPQLQDQLGNPVDMDAVAEILGVDTDVARISTRAAVCALRAYARELDRSGP